MGVTLDCRLSWKDHITDVTERTQQRLNILNRLGGCKWGSATSMLNTMYKLYIQPVMTYYCGSLITATQQNTNRLERIQNQALRLVTGAMKFTPIDAMLLLTGNFKMKSLISQDALKTHEKLIRLPDFNYFPEKSLLLLLLWCYSPWWALASFTTSFHISLCCTNSFHFLI